MLTTNLLHLIYSRGLCIQMPNLQLVAKCENAFEANEVLQNQKVDLMFLDIQMPQLNGVDFVKSLANPPCVVFTTAYPEFAVEGFELNAVDYLVKPVSMGAIYESRK